MENTREKKLQYAFGAHPTVKELHVTSDNQMFFTASDAKTHAKDLEDKEVVAEKRSDYVKSTITPAPDNQLDLELESLRARHLELFGVKAAYNAGMAKLKEKIEAEEARLVEVAVKDAEGSGDGDNVGDGSGSDGGDSGSGE